MKYMATYCHHFLPAGHQDVEETPLGLVSGSLYLMLALPLPNCVALAKSFNLSKPQFPHEGTIASPIWSRHGDQGREGI